MHDPCDFFVAGGTLRPQAPSYVVRPADQDLYESARHGEFCYVLTARQVGKSSLMVRTAEQLRAEGTHAAIVDLTSIGTVPAEEWYLGLLTRIRQALQLKIDLTEWWAEHKALSLPQRFAEFLRDVVLAEVQAPIVIFIDEIDSTLNLPFRDDFFAAIRAIYNARASESVFRRLTFVLLGVATPTDLIRDRDRTPFNIGHAIALGELEYEDAAALRDGLETCHPRYGDTILRRIFYWTNGHPYLTQKLCLAAANRDKTDWNNDLVDALVEESLLSEEGRRDTNLTFIQDRIAASLPAERRDMLRLYTQVLAGKKLLDDDRSSIQNRLELYGLIRIEDGQVRVHNRIYQQVFDREWIRALTPADSGHRTAIIAVLAAVILTAAVAIIIITRPKPSDIRHDLYVDMFTKATTDTQRLEALNDLYGLEPAYWEKSAELFYGLADSQQESLFELADVQRSRNTVEQLVTVINGLSQTLDWMPERRDRILMSRMIAALKESKGVGLDSEVDRQLEVLWLWQEGRDRAQNSEYDRAIDSYSEALQLNDKHPVILYDRARAYIDKEKPDYDSALSDLQDIIVVVRTSLPTPTPSPTGLPLTTTQVSLTIPSIGTATDTPGAQDLASPMPEVAAKVTITETAMALPTTATTSQPFQSRFINAKSTMRTVGELFKSNSGLLHELEKSQLKYQPLVEAAKQLDIASLFAVLTWTGHINLTGSTASLYYVDLDTGDYAVDYRPSPNMDFLIWLDLAGWMVNPPPGVNSRLAAMDPPTDLAACATEALPDRAFAFSDDTLLQGQWFCGLTNEGRLVGFSIRRTSRNQPDFAVDYTSGNITTTATASPMATPTVGTPPPTLTVTVTPVTEMVFRGFVRRTTGEALGNFESVQLWGTTDLGSGQSNLDAVLTMPDGSFVLRTSKVFPYYLLWLQPMESQIYKPSAATAAPGGEALSPQMIRFAGQAGGMYDGNVFLVAISTPTPLRARTGTPTATALPTRIPTSRPKLPQISLLDPAPDNTTQGQVGFRWGFSSPLPEGIYAEVVIWREGESPSAASGVVSPVRDTQITVDLEKVPYIASGRYYWSVILVRMDPYQRVTLPTDARSIFVIRSQPTACPPGGC